MPSLTAPEDLRALAASLYAALLPDWDVEMRWGDPTRTDALASVPLDRLIPARRLAFMEVWPHPPGESLLATLAHEFTHIGWSPITEFLGRSEIAIAMEEPIVERFALALVNPALSSPARAALARAAKTLPAHLLARVTTTRARSLARAGDPCPMDDLALILAAIRAALANADPAGAVAAVQALVDEIAGMLPADAMAVEDPAPVEGETLPAMMRRRFPAALARRKMPAPTDTLGAKVLARLGVTTDAEALLKISALKIADTQVTDLSGADDIRARKAAVLETMKRTGLARPTFYVDGSDELLDEWKEGTVEQVSRTLATLRRGGTPLARPAIDPAPPAPADDIPAAVRAHAQARGYGNDEKKIRALARSLNGGSVPQEQSR